MENVLMAQSHLNLPGAMGGHLHAHLHVHMLNVPYTARYLRLQPVPHTYISPPSRLCAPADLPGHYLLSDVLEPDSVIAGLPPVFSLAALCSTGPDLVTAPVFTAAPFDPVLAGDSSQPAGDVAHALHME